MGEMANGIAGPATVIAAVKAGLMGFLGAAGLSFQRVEKALDEIEAALGKENSCWGSNLIHTPAEPEAEEAMVDLYLRRGLRNMSASAFMGLTPTVVRFAYKGLRLDSNGRIRRPRHVFAKVSRPEVAAALWHPRRRRCSKSWWPKVSWSARKRTFAHQVAVSEDITVEADSAGHTDNRPLVALLPVLGN